MLERLVAYFATRHLVTNVIFVVVILGGIVAWQNTNKEELPSITFDTVRVSVSYPGAPAGGVGILRGDDRRAFAGEVFDTRESRRDLINATIM